MESLQDSFTGERDQDTATAEKGTRSIQRTAERQEMQEEDGQPNIPAESEK